ncbi:hypothetical protein EV193_10273 [Herbihabitans rhizosphaerae]|uniref:Prenyltransferase/squalene oxidase-like repeat protein n=1 Tax=Herbihabitans rhizosphaerae TaxID=1872711 RepID=A0A4Q7L1N5_9PSEU|nr:hypothetical protein [Herbihabitans rhizosphaerae]RZS43097.1 hypothetical protein EV193_10273 [Herbihabitans rhizosphaerae]
MRRWRRVLVAATVAVGVVAAVGAASAAPGEQNRWVELADWTQGEAVGYANQLDGSGQNVPTMYYAALAYHDALRHGWQDKRTQEWLGKVYGDRLASGGYGLDERMDAYGDGRWNTPDTTYAITTAWHVGRVLLAGYDAGAVPREEITRIADTLIDFPVLRGGECIAYSSSGYDQGKPCVWNVVAAAAWFLWQTDVRGLAPQGERDKLLAKTRTWRDNVRSQFRTGLGGWPYQDDTSGPQGAWHNAATVYTMAQADPSIATAALDGQFRAFPANGSNTDLIGAFTNYCGHADVTYRAAYDSAHANPPTIREKLGVRASYVFSTLLAGSSCG